VSELPEKDIKHMGSGVGSVVCNKLPWFVSEISEKDISNVVVQCSCCSLCLNYRKISQTCSTMRAIM
jgi:hypothetical protein